MTPVEHTALPWKAEPGAARGAWIQGANGEWVALACGNTDQSARANAAYLVQSANACPVLVEAVSEAIAQIEYLQTKFEGTGSGNAVLSRLRAALSTAGYLK